MMMIMIFRLSDQKDKKEISILDLESLDSVLKAVLLYRTLFSSRVNIVREILRSCYRSTIKYMERWFWVIQSFSLI